ncbi:MAG: acetyl-CoA carboxylase biotin carboxyl carrier protein [Melioribacteraceae bacterium]|nr:acetyl-CoA carboxylase biotin carboxyl carrier protein [Melioribacteraceae bacterium]
MDVNKIKQLIRIVEKSEIADFSIQEGDLKIKISKNSKNQVIAHLPMQSQNYIQSPAHTPEPVKPEAEAAVSVKLYEIKSPIVGTFYRAPAPDADPYIQVGDQVNEGSVLCIVEAMKLMNEIESDVSGKVVKILVENATPVEFNQPLFLIERN